MRRDLVLFYCYYLLLLFLYEMDKRSGYYSCEMMAKARSKNEDWMRMRKENLLIFIFNIISLHSWVLRHWRLWICAARQKEEKSCSFQSGRMLQRKTFPFWKWKTIEKSSKINKQFADVKITENNEKLFPFYPLHSHFQFRAAFAFFPVFRRVKLTSHSIHTPAIASASDMNFYTCEKLPIIKQIAYELNAYHMSSARWWNRNSVDRQTACHSSSSNSTENASQLSWR